MKSSAVERDRANTGKRAPHWFKRRETATARAAGDLQGGAPTPALDIDPSSPERFTYSDSMVHVAPVNTLPDAPSAQPRGEVYTAPKPLPESARAARALNSRVRHSGESEPTRSGRRLGPPLRPRSVEPEVTPTPAEPLNPHSGAATPIPPRAAFQRSLKPPPASTR